MENKKILNSFTHGSSEKPNASDKVSAAGVSKDRNGHPVSSSSGSRNGGLASSGITMKS
jgi:hypothetical protein